MMDMLERIPEPQDISPHIDLDDTTEPQSVSGSQEEASTTRRSMAQQVGRLEQQRQEQKEREEKLLAQLEQERWEWDEREERLLAQSERSTQALSPK
ncbi:hypothetical protein RU639_011312 [Aspergillus parasiticus]